MPDREKVFDAFRNCITEPKCKNCPWETCEKFHQAKTIPLDLCLDILKLLKGHELPTELKLKMWNALYAEEDECEKKFVGKEEHLNWFTVYRPWLQKGFDIAINAIADWEGQ